MKQYPSLRHKLSYRVINSITIYRIFAAPVLIFLIFKNQLDLFKWLLAISFFTDAIDGSLARRYKVASILGSKLDSIGDDITIVAAVIGMWIFKLQFIKDHMVIIGVLVGLLILQNCFALIRYGKVTSFHTYFAKIAAVFQGVFLMLVFFIPEPVHALFYATSIITILDLAEEIILIFILQRWEANVKGMYWVMKRK